MENKTYSLVIRDGEIVDITAQNQVCVCCLSAEDAAYIARLFLSQGYIVSVELDEDEER